MPTHRRTLTALSVAVALATAVAGAGYAAAQPLPGPTTTVPPPTPSSTTTTVPPPAPPTTPPPAPPTTPPPAPPTTLPAADPAAAPTTSAPAADAAAAQGDAGASADAPPLSSSAVAAAIESIQRSGASSTRAVMDALAPLSRFGLSPTDAAIVGMGKFPVAGLAVWTDSWHAPRSNPVPHLHMGNDLFAAFGTPVRAPSDGTVRFGEEPTGGKAAYVTEPNGTYYFMCHLQSYAPDLSSGDAVKQGQVVGFNGDTGNARGGPPHVHFEIHPGGGGAIDPKPTLDRWIAEALAAVPALLASYEADEGAGGIPHVLISTGDLRRFDVAAPGAAPDVLFVRMAEAAEENNARQRSAAALMPLTPRALAFLLGGASG